MRRGVSVSTEPPRYNAAIAAVGVAFLDPFQIDYGQPTPIVE